ncbi:MAG: lipoprotein-releasing ABC transporter permease subunit [Desulfobacterales bacterium]|nr:lipoprotein-releasing ABC transporter permease subunit [Desulfobacterales bacterium]
MSFEFFIGSRYLKTKQKQAFISLITMLTIAGVMVGVMAMIIVIAVMSGFESDLKSRILGVESHIILMRHGSSFSDYRNVLEYVENVDGVRSVAPFVYTQVMLRSSSSVSGAVLRGIDPESPGCMIKNYNKASLRESLKTSSDEGTQTFVPGIILGRELADKLGVLKGDGIYVISPRGMISPVGHMPAMRRFKVTGFFESGMYEYDGTFAYIHLSNARKILQMGDAVTGIEIRVTDIYKASKISDEISAGLGFPYWTKDWMQMNQNLFSALKLEKTVMFIILTLIVLVAAFNIASSLIMMVMEKKRDIGILKAMGATHRSIRKIFVLKGMVIGVVGTTLGVFWGFLLCFLLKKYKFVELPGDVYYISTLPVQLEAMDVFMIALAALVICYLATLYPAIQASKVEPVEAIRYG